MDQDKVFQNEVEDLLSRRIGLNPESVGSRAVLRAIKKGLRQSDFDNLADYCAALKSSPVLFESLVELMVVPETSFFRNRVSYGFLRQWIADEWKKTNAGIARRPLRVLSLPCSTGEEPYSIVITLLEEKLALEDFQVDAVDVSAAALEKAKRGIFSPYAFRRRTYRKDDRYFSLAVPASDATDGFKVCDPAQSETELENRRPVRYMLTDFVREKVNFRQGNVLDARLLADEPPYDIVFCRNLLIYFDRAARDRAFSFLDRVLRPNGLLFIGYAETGLLDLQQYQPVPYPQTFAFYKRSPASDSRADKLKEQMRDRSTTGHSAAGKSAQKARALAGRMQEVLPIVSTLNGMATSAETQRDSDLELARELADKGSAAQATELCDRYLLAHPSSAEAHLLKGELYQSLGEETAALDCFSRAVYLNPQLQAALTHLLIIQEGRGDKAQADIVRARLRRLENM